MSDYYTQEISNKILRKRNVSLFIKRIDKNNKHISGNKLYKLKYNLIQAKKEGHNSVLTFGGAFSNHIAATAYAAQENKLNSIGIIRGEEHKELNHTLNFAKSNSMKLCYLNRKEYRLKHTQDVMDYLNQKFGDFYLIPEGGTNLLGVKGAYEILDTSKDQHDFICCSVGTGGTIAGIIQKSLESQKVLGFSVLKSSNKLMLDMTKWVDKKKNWKLILDYHFGGYAKINEELINFVYEFNNRYNIHLDIIYTAKMFYGIIDLVQKDYFPKGSSILAIHTGGLQGNIGMNQRFNLNLPF